MTRALGVRAALLLAAAAVWALAAWALWPSTPPASLRLPHLDPGAYFSAAELQAAASFSRVADALWWGATAAELLALALYARFGARWARESAAGPVGTGLLLGMLGFALVWVVDLPFGVVELWWQRRHGLSHVGYVTEVFGGWLGLAGEFVFLSFALAIVMGLARRLGRGWWLAAAPAFTLLALLFAFVTPYLLGTRPLGEPGLAAAARRLERAEGVAPTPLVVEPVRDTTSLPNAEAAGLGPSRRIVVWDTLLDGRFSPAELRVVVAHEIGHLAHEDVWRQLGWFALFAFPGTFLVSLAVRRRGGMGEPGAVPLSLLVLVVLELCALPLQNAITRRIEASADWAALNATRDPAAATALFRAFVPATLDEPNPGTLDYLVRENHPTIMQRLALVEAWRRRGP